MRALVTGASGFLGKALVRELLGRGDTVAVLTRPGSDLSELAVPFERIVEWHGRASDICYGLKRHRPYDLIFNCAGLVATEHSVETLDAMLEANLALVTGLTEYAAQTNGQAALVNVGSYLEYVAGGDVSPNSLYTATKVAAEAIVEYYATHHALRAMTLKPSVIYGAGEKRPRLVHILVQAALSGKTLCLSPGAQQVNLVHVADVVESLLQAANQLLGQTYPGHAGYFALGQETLTLKDLVKRIEGIANRSISIEWGGVPYKTSEVMQPFVRGETLPGWVPQISLDKGIQELLAQQQDSIIS